MFTTRNRFTLAATLLIGSVLGLSSCYENTANTSTAPIPQPSVQLTATLNGAQEKPTPVTSPGTGTFTGVIDRTSRVMSYTVTFAGITPTAGHLHRITNANGTGGVAIPFASLTSPIIGTTPTLRQTQIDSMTQGFFYANLHTPAFPAGEIRGDIRVK
ncbi:CHRD domain-containing protein [Fibrella aquatica]|jgi:CHRD domain|uniref:CHRD domain-containing protein n=1 Tax=Fibrella aquatica TaxID=3242487 RepID=UPI003522B663